ncbi:hypothetical protein NLX62_05895, partial [Mycobacteriaceae bacterium Msp059]|nr:hypothetical protein [Mycobacteriaceae bacterium Msp059]
MAGKTEYCHQVIVTMNEVIVIENDRPVTTPILAISAIAVTASVSLGGCGGGEASRHATTELALETSQIRHDLEPLDKRFPAIGNPNAATWISGTVGAQTGSRVTVPGPSVYWIEAIIKLEPTTADTLRSNYA